MIWSTCFNFACEYSREASTGVSNLIRISPLSGTGTNSVPISLDNPSAANNEPTAINKVITRNRSANFKSFS